MTLRAQEISTRSGSCLTSLTSDQLAGNVVVAGFGDGVIRVYDRRLPTRTMMSMIWSGHHREWIQGLHMQRGGNRELVSGRCASSRLDLRCSYVCDAHSRDGVVCMWDIRMDGPIRITQAHQANMTGVAVHDHAPVFATCVPV
jgi:regulator-associated protein of mTOR